MKKIKISLLIMLFIFITGCGYDDVYKENKELLDNLDCSYVSAPYVDIDPYPSNEYKISFSADSKGFYISLNGKSNNIVKNSSVKFGEYNLNFTEKEMKNFLENYKKNGCPNQFFAAEKNDDVSNLYVQSSCSAGDGIYGLCFLYVLDTASTEEIEHTISNSRTYERYISPLKRKVKYSFSYDFDTKTSYINIDGIKYEIVNKSLMEPINQTTYYWEVYPDDYDDIFKINEKTKNVDWPSLVNIYSASLDQNKVLYFSLNTSLDYQEQLDEEVGTACVNGVYKCVYETSFFTNSDNKLKLVLETDKEGKQFVKGVASDNIEIEFDENIVTKDCECPSISVYMTQLGGHYKIYKNHDACVKKVLSVNSLIYGGDKVCSENINGKKDDTGSSLSNITSSGLQFVLTDSKSSKCSYTNGDFGTLVIDKQVNDLVSTCKYNGNDACSAQINDKNLFYKENKFYCPPSVYANKIYDYHGNYGSYKLTIYDVGTEKDDIRSENVNVELNNGSWDPDKLCDNGNCNIDITKFCNDPYVARTLKFLGLLLAIAKVIVPALIIGLGFVDLAKIVISGKAEEAKKQGINIIKRVVIGILIFLIPTILITIYNVAYSIANDSEEVTNDELNVPTNFKNCVGCILDANNKNACNVDISNVNN